MFNFKDLKYWFYKEIPQNVCFMTKAQFFKLLQSVGDVGRVFMTPCHVSFLAQAVSLVLNMVPK